MLLTCLAAFEIPEEMVRTETVLLFVVKEVLLKYLAEYATREAQAVHHSFGASLEVLHL